MGKKNKKKETSDKSTSKGNVNEAAKNDVDNGTTEEKLQGELKNEYVNQINLINQNELIVSSDRLDKRSIAKLIIDYTIE